MITGLLNFYCNSKHHKRIHKYISTNELILVLPCNSLILKQHFMYYAVAYWNLKQTFKINAMPKSLGYLLIKFIPYAKNKNTLHAVICDLFHILYKTAIDHRIGQSTLAYSSQNPMAKEMTGKWQPPLLLNLHHFCLVDHHFPLLCLLYLLYWNLSSGRVWQDSLTLTKVWSIQQHTTNTKYLEMIYHYYLFHETNSGILGKIHIK